MTQALAIQPAAHPLDDTLVLHQRPLRPGVGLDGTARFRDDRWQLGPAILQRQSNTKVLDFTAVPPRHRAVLKELGYAMLSGDLPVGEPRMSIGTVKRVFSNLSRFLTWLHDRPTPPGRPPVLALSNLTGADLLDYQRLLVRTLPNAGSRDNVRAAIRYLWRYRATLTADRLLFDPHHLEGWGEPVRRRAHENRTDRLPEQVLGPLLAWSLRFVDDFAEDILAAAEFWRVRRCCEPSPRTRMPREEVRQKLREFFDEQIARRQPLPGYHGQVNINFLATLVGCSGRTLTRLKPDLDQAAAIVGIAADSLFPTPVTAHLDGRPWIEGVSIASPAPTGLGILARTLQTACYVVIAFLSGMRDSEVKHLRRGCVSTLHDLDGKPYRTTVTSMAFKGERDPAGVEATWVVGAPAARAIEVLHRLQPPDVSLLFTSLPTSPGSRHTRRHPDTAISYSATNTQLAALIAWVNNYCALTGRADNIPQANGQPCRPTTRQFRRTLAWFIARRPGGAIAGAIAYRHHAIHMFEGYAGTSDAGFRAEVESEQALARGEHLLTMIDAHQHDNLAGPAAEEAARRLAEFGEQARFQGTVITDERQLQRLMKRDDPVIYPDRYVTCVHKHATALCQQKRDTDGQLRPQLGACRPLACRNVALTQDNLTAWHTEVERIDHELQARPLLPPLLREQLQDRRTQITTFLTDHTSQP